MFTSRTLITYAIAFFVLGLTIGLIIGLSRSKVVESKLKPVQWVGIALFVGYVLIKPEPDTAIALGILALIPGEFVGKKVGEAIERKLS